MIQYEVQLNQGNEALQTGKTITANEVLLTCDEKALAREIHHQNSLIPEDVAASVLGYFGKAAAQLMAMGFAIQFKNGQDVLMRIYPDVHLKGGNINLERAKQLNPEVTDLTLENAGELATQGARALRDRGEVHRTAQQRGLLGGAQGREGGGLRCQEGLRRRRRQHPDGRGRWRQQQPAKRRAGRIKTLPQASDQRPARGIR